MRNKTTVKTYDRRNGIHWSARGWCTRSRVLAYIRDASMDGRGSALFIYVISMCTTICILVWAKKVNACARLQSLLSHSRIQYNIERLRCTLTRPVIPDLALLAGSVNFQPVWRYALRHPIRRIMYRSVTIVNMSSWRFARELLVKDVTYDICQRTTNVLCQSEIY